MPELCASGLIAWLILFANPSPTMKNHAAYRPSRQAQPPRS